MDEKKTHEVKFVSYVIIAAFIVITAWGWYLLEQLTQWRITTLLGTAYEEPLPILVPLVISVLVPISAVIFWKRAVGIACNGVFEKATVLAIGGEVQSMRNVKFEYVFGGNKYSKKMSISSAIADQLDLGGTLNIIVDKRKPTRVLVK